jgi:hypothetical protein
MKAARAMDWKEFFRFKWDKLVVLVFAFVIPGVLLSYYMVGYPGHDNCGWASWMLAIPLITFVLFISAQFIYAVINNQGIYDQGTWRVFNIGSYVHCSDNSKGYLIIYLIYMLALACIWVFLSCYIYHLLKKK